MTVTASAHEDPFLGDVLKASVGYAGLALCVTLVFLGMRAVMDIGGACADGGPYVPVRPCPDGVPLAMIAGMFGGFLFGGIATWFGSRIGGIWGAAPLLAWSALFLSLGWNFLDYGYLNAPLDERPIWGWIVCGVLFVLMGAAPLLVGVSVFGSGLRDRGRRGGAASPFGVFPLGPTVPPRATTSPSAAGDPRRTRELGAIATDLGSAAAGARAGAGAIDAETQALLDRLERLADLRDRGLLGLAEYEAAKAPVVKALEGRS